MKKNTRLKALALILLIIVILALAVYGLITLIGQITDSNSTDISETSPVPTEPVITDGNITAPQTEEPSPTSTPYVDMTREITVSVENDVLLVKNGEDRYTFTQRTGNNSLLVFIPDSICSEKGTFNSVDSQIVSVYTVEKVNDGTMIRIPLDNPVTFTEDFSGKDLKLNIIKQKNLKYFTYRSDLSRVYLNIKEARLSSESDSFKKNYTEIYDPIDNIYTITIPKSKMPDLKSEIIMLNDRVLKTIEILVRDNDIQMIFNAYEKIKIYPNTRDFDAAFTFIPPKEDGKKLIVIDPGHGGIDGGTTNADQSILEKDIVLKMSLMMAPILKDAGFNVITLREEDIFLGLMERTDIANLADADAIISVHINSYQVKSVNGATTMYKLSDDLAASIQTSLISATGANDRGIAKYTDMSILNRAEMDSVIVETGFITNDDELAKLNTTDYQQNVAEGIAEGIINYFKGK